jgi:PEP-CTERM motif
MSADFRHQLSGFYTTGGTSVRLAKLITAIALCTIGLSQQVLAQTFMSGRTLQFSFAFPSSTVGANQARTVGPGIEFSPGDISGTYWTLDADDTTLTFSFVRATLWTIPNGWTAPFTPSSSGSLLMNGLRMSDNDGSVPNFESFQVLSGTTLQNFDSTRVRLTPDMVLVDFTGLTSTSGDKVVLQLSPVPEPSTWLLIAAGILALLAKASHSRHMQARHAAA